MCKAHLPSNWTVKEGEILLGGTLPKDPRYWGLIPRFTKCHMTLQKEFNFLLERPNQSSVKEKDRYFSSLLLCLDCTYFGKRLSCILLQSNKQQSQKSTTQFQGWYWQTRNRGKDVSIETHWIGVLDLAVTPASQRFPLPNMMAQWMVCDGCTAWLEQMGSWTLQKTVVSWNAWAGKRIMFW